MKEGAHRRNPELMSKEEVVPNWCQAFRESRGAPAAKTYVGTEIQLQQGGHAKKKARLGNCSGFPQGVSFVRRIHFKMQSWKNVSSPEVVPQ